MFESPSDGQSSFRLLAPLSILGCGLLLICLGFDFWDLRSWLQQTGSWAPFAFCAAGVLSMTVLVPKTVVSITAGALFGTQLGSFLMLWIAVAAAALNYAIAHWWLFGSINRSLDASQHSKRLQWLRIVRDLAADAGFRLHLLIRLTPLPTTLISYTMGASGSRMSPFLLAAAVAVIPQMLWVHGGTVATMVDDPNVSGLRWLSVFLSVLAAIALGIIVPREAIKRVQVRELLVQNPSSRKEAGDG